MAELYNTDRFRDLYYMGRNAPIENVGLAARFLIELFRDHAIPFAFFGGWALHLRGNNRATEDVDITVSVDMDRLKRILLAQQRLCIPVRHGQTCIQVFVHTGGTWDPEFPNTTPLAISVDIVINDFKGHLNTPPDLPNGTELIHPASETTQGPGQVPVIDVFFQVTAKLQAHYARRVSGSLKDYSDLIFLVRAYAGQIQSFCHYLNHEHRVSFVDDVATSQPDEPEFLAFVKTALGID